MEKWLRVRGQDGTVVVENSRTTYEGRLGGFLTDVGTPGEDTVRVVTEEISAIEDSQLLEEVAQELADPETVAVLATLEAQAEPGADPVRIEVIITQYPVFEHDRIKRGRHRIEDG